MSHKIQSLIVGPGAIGTILCAHIQNYSQVWVYQHKVCLELPTHAVHTNKTALDWQLLETDQPSIDLIWICCKAAHSLSTATKLLTQFPLATVVLLHNGMGPQQQLATQFPNRVIFATTTNAAFKQDDQLFHQKAFGATALGYPSTVIGIAQNWVKIIASWPGNMGFQEDQNILTSMWTKLAMNAVINPLTAFYQVRNGALLDIRYQETISFLCHEIQTIAQAEAIALPQPLAQTIYGVIKLTADNFSSMQQDVQHQRHTEVEYILGFLLTCASKHQINAPHIQHWYQAILSRYDSFVE